MSEFATVGFVVLALVGLGLVFLWNGLVRARNEVRNAWAQIDVQLKRRHDLVPNLVRTVGAYAEHEKELLERVTEARAEAQRAHGPAARSDAEDALASALDGVLVVAEAYPELQASGNFLALQEELASTENRIGFARQAYNDAVASYNTRREVFPANLISGGFERAETFVLRDAAERRVPDAAV